MADFINDRAFDKISEHSDSAEEGISAAEDVDRYVYSFLLVSVWQLIVNRTFKLRQHPTCHTPSEKTVPC